VYRLNWAKSRAPLVGLETSMGLSLGSHWRSVLARLQAKLASPMRAQRGRALGS
jgi:hypothetical protein